MNAPTPANNFCSPKGIKKGLTILPIKLRLMIWTLVLGEPRVHRIRLDLLKCTVFPTETLRHSTAISRAALSTCRESRLTAKKVLPNVIPLRGGGVLRYDANKDVVNLAQLTLWGLVVARETLRQLEHSSKRHSAVSPTSSEAQWMGEVRRIGFEIRYQPVLQLGFWLNPLGESTLELARLMARFTALSHLFLISQPTEDEGRLFGGGISNLYTNQDLFMDPDYDSSMLYLFDEGQLSEDEIASVCIESTMLGSLDPSVPGSDGAYVAELGSHHYNAVDILHGFISEQNTDIQPGEGLCFVGMDEDKDCYLWGYAVSECLNRLGTMRRFSRLVSHLSEVMKWKQQVAKHLRHISADLGLTVGEATHLGEVRVGWLLHDYRLWRE